MALAEAQSELAAGVHGGDPIRFSGPEVDEYLRGVGLGPGRPWCAAFVRHCFEVAATKMEVPDPCPKTASALHLWNCGVEQGKQVPLPAPGDVFVLIHPDGIHGHCGFVESCSPGGDVITTIEGDTNAQGSSTGDAVARHTWTPASGARGRLLGYLAF